MWGRALRNAYKLFFLYVLAPPILMTIVLHFVFPEVEADTIFSEVLTTIPLICMYLSSVYATCRHLAWREDNIPALLMRNHS